MSQNIAIISICPFHDKVFCIELVTARLQDLAKPFSINLSLML